MLEVNKLVASLMKPVNLLTEGETPPKVRVSELYMVMVLPLVKKMMGTLL